MNHYRAQFAHAVKNAMAVSAESSILASGGNSGSVAGAVPSGPINE